MATSLTQGTVSQFQASDTSGHHVVQVIDHKVLAGQQTRHRLLISDGNFFMQAMLATQLNDLISNGSIALHAVIRINECIVNRVQNRMVCIILHAQALYNPLQLLGNPVPFGEVSPPFAAVTAEKETALRRLGAITVSRQIVPAPVRPANALATRPTGGGPLCWLPGAGWAARMIEPRFVMRVAHVFEADSNFPRATSALVSFASRVHAALSAAELVVTSPPADARPHSPLALLPGELLCLLVQQHVCRDSMLPLALSCLALRDAVYIALARGRAKFTTSISSAVLSGRVYANWAVSHAGCPLSPLTCAAAAAGRLDAVRWAVSNGSPWTIECSAAAARVGAVDVLQWAEDRGLPIASVFAQDAARQHARRLFALLGMEEVDPDMLREFLERRAAAATAQFTSAQISDNLVRVPDLETTVLTFFRGADNLNDDEQYAVSGPSGLVATVRIGVSEEQLLGAVNTLQASGELRRIGESDRYRAQQPHTGRLEELVHNFFYFGGGTNTELDDMQGYSVTQLFDWARGLGASVNELIAAVEALNSDGYIYSTVDDDHFKVTG